MNRILQKIIFSGREQGVGFRYRSKYAADGCGVTGWVHNEDGTVSMEAQGTVEQINQMLIKQSCCLRNFCCHASYRSCQWKLL